MLQTSYSLLHSQSTVGLAPGSTIGMRIVKGKKYYVSEGSSCTGKAPVKFESRVSALGPCQTTQRVPSDNSTRQDEHARSRSRSRIKW